MGEKSTGDKKELRVTTQFANNAKLAASIVQLQTVRKAKSDMEKREKQVMAQIKDIIGDSLEKEYNACTAGPVMLASSPMRRVSINGQRLLDRGVDPEIITDCTDITKYFTYHIKLAKSVEPAGGDEEEDVE